MIERTKMNNRIVPTKTKSPLSLIHPDIYSDETISLVTSELRSPLYPHQKPNPILSKQELLKLPQHVWMNKCEFTLIHPDNTPDLDNFLQQLRDESVFAPDFTLTKEEQDNNLTPKLLSLDLETTGLNKTIRIIGGYPTTPSLIAGVCIASSATKGYYLPVLHNKSDNIPNYTYPQIQDFLTKLQEFKLIYHNAAYDREVLETNNIKLNKEYADTMLIAIAQGLRESMFSVGLKSLSEKLLNRKMLELDELSGQKKYIPVTYYPASSLEVYGCSDAVNTYGLFEQLTKNKDTNPYLLSKLTTNLDLRVNDYTRWMLRHGLPIDYGYLTKNIRTLIRRKIILTEKFEKEITNTIPISSAEKVGMFLGEILSKAYKDSKQNSDMTPEELDKALKKELMQHFQMEMKVKALKSGETKTTFSTGADILSSLIKIDNKTIPWLSQDLKQKLKQAAIYLEKFRNISHDIGVFMSMYRYAYTDDLNYSRINIGLKFNGTVTNRYSNQSGKGSLDRFSITKTTKKVNLTYQPADATAGLNVQGLNSSGLKLKPAYKVKRAPDEFIKHKQALDLKVEAQLLSLLSEA